MPVLATAERKGLPGMIEIVFETHATTEDNEAGRATGWLPGRLSPRGRSEAAELGRRRADDGIAAVFCSDLRRSVETAELAFGESGIPVLLDWRLRECDYGRGNGMPAAEIHGQRRNHLEVPYPGGESWRQATDRIGRFLTDLPSRWSGRRIVVIGHVATRWGLDRVVHGAALADLAAVGFDWKPGWEYRLTALDHS